jgi:hypothetical protein
MFTMANVGLSGSGSMTAGAPLSGLAMQTLAQFLVQIAIAIYCLTGGGIIFSVLNREENLTSMA